MTPALLFVMATAVWTGLGDGRSAAAARVRRLRGQRLAAGDSVARPVAAWPPGVLRVVGAVGAGTLAASLLGGSTGALGGVVVGVATWWWVGRLEPRAVRRRRELAERDLPFAVDLFAGALAAGATAPRALAVAGDALGGPIGAAFARAATAAALGAPASESVASWRSDPALAGLAPIVRLLVRSEESGSSVAAAADRLVVDVRATARWRIEAVARRVGVRATAPLGLCFLPAFVLLGVVPLVLGGLHAVSW